MSLFSPDGWLARTWWWPFAVYFAVMAFAVLLVELQVL